VPGGRAPERLAKLSHLAVPANELGQPSSGRRLQPRPDRSRSGHLVDLDWRAQSLDRHRAERLHPDVTLGQPEHLGRQEDRPWCGHLFHPARQVGRLPDGRVIHVQVVADRADHHLSRVQPHSDLDEHALGPSHGLGVLRYRFLHPERRVARAHRVILMGQRRAEQRHDAIAHDLVDGALVAVDGLHHPLEDGVEELARLLGVPVGEQLHRALQIGEEDRHLLTLALQRAL
jgi:hypothetical protein